jgi:hypothetical protein
VQAFETPCAGYNPEWGGLEPPPPVFPHNPEAQIVPGGAMLCDFSSPFYCTAKQENAFTAADVYGMSGLAGACIQSTVPYGENRCEITTAGHCASTTNGNFIPGQLICPQNTRFAGGNDIMAWISPEGTTPVTHLLGQQSQQQHM